MWSWTRTQTWATGALAATVTAMVAVASPNVGLDDGGGGASQAELDAKLDVSAAMLGDQVVRTDVGPSYYWQAVEEGFTTTAGAPWNRAGANCSWTSPAGVLDSAPAVASGDMGTAATDVCYVVLGSNWDTKLQVGGGAIWGEARVRFSALADATNDYLFRCGFLDTTGNGNPTDAVAFSYDRSDSTAWKVWVRDAGTGTTTAAGSPTTVAIDTWYKLTIIINSDGTAATFYLNDVEYATVSSGMPDAGDTFGFTCTLAAEAGNVGAVVWYYDYVAAGQRFATPR